MICFLASRLDDPRTGELSRANGLADELRKCLPVPCRALDICSDPDGWEKMDFYAGLTRKMFEDAGIVFERFDTLDSRNEAEAAKLVRGSDLLILSGGHVPTQNRFFEKIGLRGLLEGYDGVVAGISAGSMNSADEVYSLPEEEGEALDPAYRRFFAGLNLTKVNLLPHYQENKDDVLDGMRIYEEIACPDSMGKTFFAIPDGSYLFVSGGREELRGEAYMIRDGVISRVSSDGEAFPPDSPESAAPLAGTSGGNRFYEETLPEGYREAMVVDAGNRELGARLTKANVLANTVLFAAIFLFWAGPRIDEIAAGFSVLKVLALPVAYILYIVLHELAHGVVYKLLTGKKLTFGVKPPVAYCGVPGIYAYRVTAMLSLFTPLTVFSVVFVAAFLLAGDPFTKLLILCLTALHLSGCVGDLHNIGLFLTRFRDPSVLRYDTGPKQIYYTKQ